MDKTKVEQVQQLLDQALQLLREDRDIRTNARQVGARELSEAITCFETGSMWANRSLFADQPYTPVIKNRVVEESVADIRQSIEEPKV